MTDYHFDMDFHAGDGLVLYPHFSAEVIPGWFDKALPWRRAHAQHYDRVVLVTPSKEFVATLPNGKIPDRKDFEKLGADERIRCWRQVLKASERLADDFQELVESGVGLDRIRPFSERDR